MYRNLRSATQRRESIQSFREDSFQKVEEDIEFYAKKLETERRRLTTLNTTIKDVEAEIAQRKEDIIKVNKSMDPAKNRFAYTKSLNAKKKTDILHKKNDWLLGKIGELQAEIDQLRRDRATLLKNITRASNEIDRLDEEVMTHHSMLETKNKLAEQAKLQITTMKQKFTKEQSSFHKRFKNLKKQYQWQVLNNLKDDSHYQSNQQFESFDTATLLKRQLQAIIINNKQKIKMIDIYQRNMRVLDDAFNNIKETSGLTDINEIQAIFVKSEEQNCALLTYLDMLNQEMDALTDSNLELQEKCEQQQKQNAQREALLNSMPQEQKRRRLMKQIAADKMVLVNEVNETFSKITPKMLQCLCKLRGNPSLKDNTNITRFNYERYLGEIDQCINLLIKRKANELNVGTSMFERALRIDKLPEPAISRHQKVPDPAIEVPMDASQMLYDYSKLQDIAKEHVKKITERKQNAAGRRRQTEKT